jgi:hypothetical protein
MNFVIAADMILFLMSGCVLINLFNVNSSCVLLLLLWYVVANVLLCCSVLCCFVATLRELNILVYCGEARNSSKGI